MIPIGARGGRGRRQPAWRNRRTIAAGAAVAAAAVAAALIAIAATGNGTPQPTARAAPPPATATPRGEPTTGGAQASLPAPQPSPSSPGTAARSHTALVTRADLGPDWPLTVSSGWVRCVATSSAYTFRTTGSGARTYALNLAALKLGYPSITAIQIQSQDGTGEPADVSPLQERAANLC